jgi:hypothetical protein
MQPMPDLARTKICKTLINTGYCNDPECTYAHNKEELRNVPGVAPQLPIPREVSSGSAAGTKAAAQANAGPSSAAAGFPFNPTAAGMPSMPAGQNLDPNLAIAMQQWMSSMTMHLTQMQIAAASQNQDSQGQGGAENLYLGAAQQQGAGPGQSFLYNALFNGADNSRGLPPGTQGQPVLPSTRSGTGPVSGSSGSKKIKNKIKVGPAVQVDYKVKNTFIDVDDPSASPAHGGMRNVRSAAARLYSYGGDGTPPQSNKDGASPVPSTSLAPLTLTEDNLTTAFGNCSLKTGDGYETPGLNLPRLPRDNTWASNLDAVGEEIEDIDNSPVEQEQANTHGSEISGLFSSEKRLQDTPFGMDQSLSMGPSDSDGDGRARFLSFDSRGREGSDLSARDIELDNVVIKNTFLEYKPQPTGGMRQVQTASGRLDLMSQE